MNSKEAKRLSKLEKELLYKFVEAKKAEGKHRSDVEELIEQKIDIKLHKESPLLKDMQEKPIPVQRAKQLQVLDVNNQQEFASQHRRDEEENRQREKKYAPITKAIKETTSKEVVPVARFVTSTPRAIRFEDEEEEDSPLGLPTTPEKESFRQNKSLKQLMDTKTITLGLIASSYFPRANDKRFGIYYDADNNTVKIGSEPITFENDDIIIRKSNKKYHGTEGLWLLLTENNYFKLKGKYTADDWETYKEILWETNSIYQKNDPKTNKPKSSSGWKWKGMIKKIWDESDLEDDETDLTGSGLAQYNENPVEYKYISNLHELIQRLSYIQAQEAAGNNNFHNEKLALAEFLSDRLKELIETPKGNKYLVRCLSVLPEQMIEGSGIFNDFLNSKWMPEIHAPGYQFLGPFTKLDKRLARGDKGINKLDRAAKRHDIFYRDHKDTESRHIADKILEGEAWDRVVSKDADLDERLVGLATTGGMWLKRKLGMGLSSSGFQFSV